MSISQIEDAKILKSWAKKVDREGVAEESYQIAKRIVELYEKGECVEQMIEVGKMRAVSTGAKADCYFREKIDGGFYKQVCKLRNYN